MRDEGGLEALVAIIDEEGHEADGPDQRLALAVVPPEEPPEPGCDPFTRGNRSLAAIGERETFVAQI